MLIRDGQKPQLHRPVGTRPAALLRQRVTADAGVRRSPKRDEPQLRPRSPANARSGPQATFAVPRRAAPSPQLRGVGVHARRAGDLALPGGHSQGATPVACATDHVITPSATTSTPATRPRRAVEEARSRSSARARKRWRRSGSMVWPMVRVRGRRRARRPGRQVRSATPSRCGSPRRTRTSRSAYAERVSHARPRRKRTLDRGRRRARDTALPPRSIADWLALVGDSADNYPGLPGWGRSLGFATVLARPRTGPSKRSRAPRRAGPSRFAAPTSSRPRWPRAATKRCSTSVWPPCARTSPARVARRPRVARRAQELRDFCARIWLPTSESACAAGAQRLVDNARTKLSGLGGRDEPGPPPTVSIQTKPSMRETYICTIRAASSTASQKPPQRPARADAHPKPTSRRRPCVVDQPNARDLPPRGMRPAPQRPGHLPARRRDTANRVGRMRSQIQA